LSPPRELGARINLYWLPLGAGGRFVRFNGRVYARSDLRPKKIQPPEGRRAPGWAAGIRVAALSDPKERIRAASGKAKSAAW
jgi:hypothetical protein